MIRKKVATYCLLIIYAINSFASSSLISSIATKSTVSRYSNPFYPKYLRKNVEHAIKIIVEQKIKKNREQVNKISYKNKKISYKNKKKSVQMRLPSIPNSINVKFLTRNNSGRYNILTQQGLHIQKGSKLYDGTVVKISKFFIYLSRKEKRVIKYYKIRYSVIF